MTPLAWVAGQVLPLAEAKIRLDDPGFLLGDGVFETLRARHGQLFRWDLHAERLAVGLAAVGIDRTALAEAERGVHALAARAACDCEDDLYLRVQVVRTSTGAGEVTALARPVPHYPERLYRKGARLAIADWRRDPADPLVGVKSLSYLPQVLARREAQARGFDDALILNTRGRVCEATHANVIARRGATLYTPGPKEGALNGVTRQVLLAEAGRVYNLCSSLNWEELEAAEEVVLVSTLAGVVPVAEIKGVGDLYMGPVGELAGRFAAAYEALLETASGERSSVK